MATFQALEMGGYGSIPASVGNTYVFNDLEVNGKGVWILDQKLWEAVRESDGIRYAMAVFRCRPNEDTCLRHTAIFKIYMQLKSLSAATPNGTRCLLETAPLLGELPAITRFEKSIIEHQSSLCGRSFAFWDRVDGTQLPGMPVPGGFLVQFLVACTSGIPSTLERSAETAADPLTKMHTTIGPHRSANCFAEFIKEQEQQRDP